MIPISDENPTKLKPFVTSALMVVCVGVYIWQIQLAGDHAFGEFLETKAILGYAPAGSGE